MECRGEEGREKEDSDLINMIGNEVGIKKKSDVLPVEKKNNWRTLLCAWIPWRMLLFNLFC